MEKDKVWRLDHERVLYPTEKKIKLETNQIKRQDFELLESYIPDIMEQKSNKRGHVVWINVIDGFLWYIKPYKPNKEALFVPKNKANKIYLSTILNK